MKNFYKMIGSVRGECNHKHRTISGAAKCFLNDSSGCKKQGGYSDRNLVKFIDDEQVKLSEDEFEDFVRLINTGV